jgi:ubiquinone/menaquinone biosynthesis C-methylase UbiE/DNA-binding transcriptional ArsR family regulator
MSLSTDRMLIALRAIAEDTRLRIVALLAHGELTVSDLTDILGQSQPRISRHLKLLNEAGVVDKHREGTWAFFDLTPQGPIRETVDAILARVDAHDPAIAADLDRRDVVQQRRAAAAQEYFAAIAPSWDEERSLHAPDDVVEAAIVEALAARPAKRVLDLGTGTGRMLQLLAADAERVERAVGLDNSHSMLAIARANLERAELRHIDLRQGDVYSPPFDRGEFDLVVLHQVLHFLDDPARAVREASRLLAPGGRLLIVDFAPHGLEFLRTDHAHRRLGFRSDLVESWLAASGLDLDVVRTIAAGDDPAPDRLTVTLWLGTDPQPSPTELPDVDISRIARDDSLRNERRRNGPARDEQEQTT